MTDNGSGYIARLFRKALRMLGIRHIRTRPYTPKTNGKAERFSNQTHAVKSILSDRPFLGGHASLRAHRGGT
jgi:transposase InsO family protein